jgi:hypothetical protein
LRVAAQLVREVRGLARRVVPDLVGRRRSGWCTAGDRRNGTAARLAAQTHPSCRRTAAITHPLVGLLPPRHRGTLRNPSAGELPRITLPQTTPSRKDPVGK